MAEEPFRRAAQKALAGDMVTLVHGSEAYAAVLAASEALFGRGDLRSLDADTLRDAVAELPTGPVAVGMPITEALVAVGLVESRNAARRAIADGGASVNGTKVSDAESVLTEEDFLHGEVAILRRGRKAMEERTPSGGARAGLEHRTKQAGPRTDTHPPRRLAEPIWSVANWTLK